MQAQMVRELRGAGYSVAVISGMGNDIPDLIVGRNGVDRLVEIKTVKSGSLTDGQLTFIGEWKGAAVILAYSSEDVMAAFNQRMRSVMNYGAKLR
jgi:Holliday junction resolvase